MLLALAVGPQLLGHSSFNWALKYAPATLIAVAILGEPIGSTFLAWLLLGESVEPPKLAGMALLLAGVFLAMAGTGGRGRCSRRRTTGYHDHHGPDLQP